MGKPPVILVLLVAGSATGSLAGGGWGASGLAVELGAWPVRVWLKVAGFCDLRFSRVCSVLFRSRVVLGGGCRLPLVFWALRGWCILANPSLKGTAQKRAAP